MLKLIFIGVVGASSALGGLWLKDFLLQRAQTGKEATLGEETPIQVKTEMTGIPVVKEGKVAGYIVFQISSTVDVSSLGGQDFNVAPYILDAAIRASYMSTENGDLVFDAAFLKKLSDLIVKEANTKLSKDAVRSVNLEQFNFVPKDEIRNSVHTGASK